MLKPLTPEQVERQKEIKAVNDLLRQTAKEMGVGQKNAPKAPNRLKVDPPRKKD